MCARAPWAWLFCLALAGSLVGCKRTSDVNTNPPGQPPPMGMPPMGMPPMTFLEETGPHAAGKKVYNQHGCARCHTIGAKEAPAVGVPPKGEPPQSEPPQGGPPQGGPPQGGPPMAPPLMMPKGPDLATVGGKAEHTVDWFMEYISDPTAKKADAKMPPFKGKIKKEDLRALAEFLASLK